MGYSAMTRFHVALLTLGLLVFGSWGCSRSTTPPANADRLRSLETQNARLEDDLRSISSVRDQLRSRLSLVEDEQARLQQEVERLQQVVRERDELRVTLKTRTQERDIYQAEFEGFRKGLRELIGQTEVSLTSKLNPAPSGGNDAKSVPAIPVSR
jgi:TolA-binding protein